MRTQNSDKQNVTGCSRRHLGGGDALWPGQQHMRPRHCSPASVITACAGVLLLADNDAGDRLPHRLPVHLLLPLLLLLRRRLLLLLAPIPKEEGASTDTAT